MKILVETKGSFMLVDYPGGGQVVEAHRPSVVTQTDFINSRASLGQVRFLGELTDEATDEEFEKYVGETDDMELAVAAFMASFGLEKPTEKKSSKGKGKAKAEVEVEVAEVVVEEAK